MDRAEDLAIITINGHRIPRPPDFFPRYFAFEEADRGLSKTLADSVPVPGCGTGNPVQHFECQFIPSHGAGDVAANKFCLPTDSYAVRIARRPP
jgi:hypothetical protein